MIKFRFSIFLCVFSFTGTYSSAQDNDSLPERMKMTAYHPVEFSLTNFYGNEIGNHFQHEVGITSQVVLHSNAFPLSVSLALLNNKFIDEENKSDVANNLEKKNAFELCYDFRAYGSWIQDSFLFRGPAWYSVDYSLGNFNAGQFTDDAFKIIFYGNASYADKTADLSGTKTYLYNYSRIGFSAQKKFQGSKSHWETGAKISLLSIRSAIKAKMPHATLFTEQNGEYIDASYEFEYVTSDSSNHGTFSTDGIGSSIDLQLSWLNKEQTTRLSFYLNNFGIAHWNKQSQTFAADTAIHFEGLVVNNLFSEGSSFIPFNTDSLLKITGTKETRGARTFLLPARLTFVYSQSLSKTLLLHTGISYMPYADLIPMLFVKPQWILSSSFQLAAVASAGGTARFGVGADALITIKKQFKIIFGSDNLLGLLIPKQTTSSSLFLQMAFQF